MSCDIVWLSMASDLSNIHLAEILVPWFALDVRIPMAPPPIWACKGMLKCGYVVMDTKPELGTVINKYIHFYMKQLSILNQILIECCGRSDPTKYHAIEIKHQNDRTREWAALYFNDNLGSGLDPFVERMVNLLVSFFPLLSSSFVIINEIDDTTQNVDHFQNWKNCSMAFLRYKSRG